MTAVEETYRKIDPEGFVNMAYEDTERKDSPPPVIGVRMLEAAQGISDKPSIVDFQSKEKSGKNLMNV